jgi:polyhydroxyalkanoate synthesis repressor PhaR
MAETRIIKRYANRKLYDTQRSRYVTLEQIADMIRSGEDVKIVDNNSKEDLTTITLAQIIFEEEKKQKSFLPLNAMKNIIQSGGERIEELVTQAQKRVSNVFARKHEKGANGELEAPVPVEEQPEQQQRRALAAILEEWQHKIDERLRHAVEALSPFSTLQKDVATLTARLAEVERRLAEQEQQHPVSPPQIAEKK